MSSQNQQFEKKCEHHRDFSQIRFSQDTKEHIPNQWHQQVWAYFCAAQLSGVYEFSSKCVP